MHKLILFIVVALFTIENSVHSQSITGDPYESKIIFDDVYNFIDIYTNSVDSIRLADVEEYLDKGTAGLHSFIPGRIVSADALADYINANRSLYNQLEIKEEYKAKIRSHYYGLKYWYPYAKFPDLYIVVGRNNSGGTSKDNKLILGLEKIKDSSDIPFVAIHECIHSQQNHRLSTPTLLEQSIIEGAADFIAELIVGDLPNKNTYNYGHENLEQLKYKFSNEMNSTEFGIWLYDDRGINGVVDLGYFMGYKICESFFKKSEDKRLAINEIINVDDFENFLIRSDFFEDYFNPQIIDIIPSITINDDEEDYTYVVEKDVKEIELLFNLEMTGQSFAKVEGSSFPLTDVIGYDETHKRFKLAVNLGSDKIYRFKVTGRGFKSKSGQRLDDVVVTIKVQ